MSETTSSPKTAVVAVLDPFAGADPAVAALHAALRAEGVGAEVTSDPASAVAADGLVIAASVDAAEALRALRNRPLELRALASLAVLAGVVSPDQLVRMVQRTGRGL